MTEAEVAAEREILARERATRPIAVRPDFVRVTGSFDGAVFLSQLLYWFGDDAKGNQRARVQRDGYAWVAKSADDWAIEVGALTLDGKPRPSMIRRVSKELSQAGLIATKVWKFAGVPTVHYRPEWTRLRDLLEVAWQNGFEAGRQIPDLRQVDKSNSSLGANPTKEAETTTETTKELAAPNDGAGATPNGTAGATPRKRRPSKPKADDAPKTPKPVQPHVALVDAMYDALGQTEHRDYPLNVKDAKAMLEAEYTPADVTRITAGLMRDRGAFYAANHVALNMALVRKNAGAYPNPNSGTTSAGGAPNLNGYAKYAYTVPSTGRLAMKGVYALIAEGLAPDTAEPLDRTTWTPEMLAAEAAIQGVTS